MRQYLFVKVIFLLSNNLCFQFQGMKNMVWKQFDTHYTGRDTAIIGHLNAVLLVKFSFLPKLILLSKYANIAYELFGVMDSIYYDMYHTSFGNRRVWSAVS